MKIYFSTNEKYYSKFMRWLFKEPSSHVGLGFSPDGTIPLVLDCTKPYGKIYHLDHWKKKYRITYSMDLALTKEDEEEAYILTTNNAVLKPYDWDAYFYGFLRGIAARWYGIPLPFTNRYSSDDADLCTEVLNPIKQLLLKYQIELITKDLAAMTPHMLAKELHDQTLTNEKVTWHDFPTQTP